ncbi:hypothetical protein FUAX_21140 [Fulvitalea axinellae]|uniref:Transmembrane protein n=1 Tax=Fulvitalea axinellae TaxID=1182444 RepID=A0AAU9CWB2_9BACT|nr:hypothetical protein FUAX_21140 [Fulvitalea axinellae]
MGYMGFGMSKGANSARPNQAFESTSDYRSAPSKHKHKKPSKPSPTDPSVLAKIREDAVKANRKRLLTKIALFSLISFSLILFFYFVS